MKKSIKKIAVSLLTATMVIGSVSAAFASSAPTETCKKDAAYSVVGSCYADADKQWKVESADCVMSGENGSYTMDLGKLTAAADYQFKIVMDGEDNAWIYQLLAGSQYFGDNCSQFYFDLAEDANVKVTYDALKGEVKVFADDAEVDLMVSLLSDERAVRGNDLIPAKDATIYAAQYLDNAANGIANVYSVVGDTGLMDATGKWDNAATTVIMNKYDANTGSVYVTSAFDVKPGTYEFKILQDPEDNAWSKQVMANTLELGDNYTQFSVTVAEAGPITVLYSLVNGQVRIYQKVVTGQDDDGNDKTSIVDLDYSAKLDTSKAIADFVSKNEITDGVVAAAFAVQNADAIPKTLSDVDTKIALPLTSFDAGTGEGDGTGDGTGNGTTGNGTASNGTAGTDTTAPTTSTTAPTTSTTAAKTGDVAPVALMVVLFAAVAVVAVVAKKKEA